MAEYAHQAETFHGYRGLILDGLRGKVDALELLQFCVDEYPMHTEHYYHLLDLSIRLTATAGSDFPWCGQDHGHGPPERSSHIGNARFYTRLNGPLAFANWRAAVRAGHTFVSSGPMLNLRASTPGSQTAISGDHLALRKGSSLTLTGEAYGHTGQVPRNTLELVSHGRVTARQPGQSAIYPWWLPCLRWITAGGCRPLHGRPEPGSPHHTRLRNGRRLGLSQSTNGRSLP